MFSGLGLVPLVLIFGVAAGAVWVAGVHLRARRTCSTRGSAWARRSAARSCLRSGRTCPRSRCRLAGLLSGSEVLPQAQATDIYLTALGIVLTVVYLWGLVTRPHRQVWRMGIDSAAVLLLYAAGIAGLIAVSNS